MSTLTVYGLATCDTCRKARKWLESQNLQHRFHDVRKDGLDKEELGRWLRSPFAGKLLNRQSTTWRQLSNSQKSDAEKNPQALLLEYPTLLKRPVFVIGSEVLAVGFRPNALAETLKMSADNR